MKNNKCFFFKGTSFGKYESDGLRLVLSDLYGSQRESRLSPDGEIEQLGRLSFYRPPGSFLPLILN